MPAYEITKIILLPFAGSILVNTRCRFISVSSCTINAELLLLPGSVPSLLFFKI